MPIFIWYQPFPCSVQRSSHRTFDPLVHLVQAIRAQCTASSLQHETPKICCTCCIDCPNGFRTKPFGPPCLCCEFRPILTPELLLTMEYQQQAGLSGIEATGCSVTDIHCICNSVPFVNTLRSYIEAQCDASDQASSFGKPFVLSMHIR